MTEFAIIEAKPWHCGAMSRLLRPEHQRAVAMIGMNSHRELRARFDASSFRKAWLIDGHLAGLGGVTGPTLSAIGMVWLALSDRATAYPLAIIKEAKHQLEEIMTVKRVLFTAILDDDEAAKRFAVFLGFHDDEPAISRHGRRTMLRRLEEDDTTRIPIGHSAGIVLTYEGRAF